jgi:capsular polysaccharide biosynthesis protein
MPHARGAAVLARLRGLSRSDAFLSTAGRALCDAVQCGRADPAKLIATSDLAQGASFTVARVTTHSGPATTPLVLLTVIDTLKLEVTAAELAENITVSAPFDTSIIDVAVTDADPRLAADIANAVSQSLADTVQDIEQPNDVTGAPAVKLTRVQVASVPSVPVSPNIPLNIALGALVGLTLGVGLALLRETIGTRIPRRHEVE